MNQLPQPSLKPGPSTCPETLTAKGPDDFERLAIIFLYFHYSSRIFTSCGCGYLLSDPNSMALTAGCVYAKSERD
jgi:hypothetical protein